MTRLDTTAARPPRARGSLLLRRLLRAATPTLASAALLAVGAAPAPAGSGPAALRAAIESDPWRLSFVDGDSRTILEEAAQSEAGSPGKLGFRTASGWAHATRVLEQRREGKGLRATLDTTDAGGRRFEVHAAPAGDGVVAVRARIVGGATTDVLAIGIGWASPDGDERFYGLGERADAVEHRGATVESYVSDGPYPADEWPIIGAVLPEPGFRAREDSTYFPIPWILSSRGYGVLVDNDETVYHHLASRRDDQWSFEVRGAPEGFPERPAPAELRFRVFAGPRPADALARFSARVGRQPAIAAPWVLGPWFQPGGSLDEQLAQIDKLRDADAPLSVGQTYLHYLPCGGNRAGEPARTAAFHERGLAITTYFNPMICESYAERFDAADRRGALVRDASGESYLYDYFTSRVFHVGQFDFSGFAGRAAFRELLDLAIEDGHDGWMEDFGEYTPLDALTDDGRDGSATHNRYVVDYHCAAYELTRRQSKPVVRFQRSGWTGAARCAQVVWGGDPTTDWGFDGLASAVRSGLGMGLSGVSTWGSDIGGFFSFNGRYLTDELLMRWVQFGAVSGVMRTERDGGAIPKYERPQVEDDDQIDNWRRWTKLRTQLYPYLAAAAETYRRTGMPIMRHLVLAYPDDAQARERDDEILFGPDILAAPVLEAGATSREVYLPAGTWIDLWRSARFEPSDGSIALERAALLDGGRSVVVPAPLDELPLLVRAGALIPLLPADVDTLAAYGRGAPGLVRLADRRGRRQLLAFPRGRSGARLESGGALESREGEGRWELDVRGATTSWSLQASLAALEAPLVPCAVEWNGTALAADAWTYDAQAQVLRVRFAGGGARLVVHGRCG